MPAAERNDAAERECCGVPLLCRLNALADEKRLRILEILGEGEKCVCDLAGALGAGQSLLSFHLRTLKEAGLVADRREGRWAYYSLLPEALAEVADQLGGLAPAVPAEPAPSPRATADS